MRGHIVVPAPFFGKEVSLSQTNRGFLPVRQPCNEGGVLLPLRATRTSAGYDFFATCDLSIRPGETGRFITDVKAYMGPNEMLMLVVRSSAGIRRGLMAANTIGIVDSDYFDNPDNEGNLHIVLRNLLPAMALEGQRSVTLSDGTQLEVPIIRDLSEENTVHIKKGERVVQGIFVPVLPSDNCNSNEQRMGGFGSTGQS